MRQRDGRQHARVYPVLIHELPQLTHALLDGSREGLGEGRELEVEIDPGRWGRARLDRWRFRVVVLTLPP